MKLASLREGGRDGLLVVVSRDLTRALAVPDIAPTLQSALDRWAEVEPGLRAAAVALEQGEPPGWFPFDPSRCASPLPRAYQWADGSAYLNHVELVRKARGAEMPPSFLHDPLLYQGGSDGFLGPTEDIAVPDEAFGIDFEAEVAVVTDDVPMGVDAETALRHVKLLMLVNDVSLRHLVPGELQKGFGFFQSKPASAFAPVALTPDELGDAWRDGKVHLPLRSYVNGELFGCPDAGRDMNFHFGQLIAHAARTRRLGAGTIIGSGTVSNRGPDGGPGRPVAEGGVGYSCIAEQRMVEILRHGRPLTPFLRYGDRVRIEMRDREGRSLFGAIDQKVVPA